MLQLIHRFKKSVFAIVLVLLAGLTLAGVGLGSGSFGPNSADNNAVAVIDGRPISSLELSRARNDGQIPAQQALDGLVDRAVIRRFAERNGLAAGEGSIRQTLTDIAPGGLTQQGISEMLASLRMTPNEFEREIQNESVARQLYAAISSAIVPSALEIDRGVKEFAVVKSVVLASASPETFLAQTALPSDEQIERYYSEQTSDFEVPAAVSYAYVVFSPEKYRDSVSVTDEDTELYYADNPREFSIPASVTAKHIRLLYSKDSKPEALNKVRERAHRAYTRAKAGESFETLVLEFSDDVASKLLGGSLGTVSRGKIGPAFDAAVFKLKEPGLAELIEADYGFQIVQVTQVQPESTKPLAAVKDEIRTKLQQIEAPAYASARAAELLAEWKKVGGGLMAFAAARGLAVASTGAGTTGAGLTGAEDPSPSLKGLTRALISHAQGARQQIELDHLSVLAEVTARRDVEVASVSAAKGRITNILRLREANGVLQKKSEQLSKSAKLSDFEKSAKALGFAVQPAVEVKSQESAPPEGLNKGALISKIRNTHVPTVLAPVFADGSAYIAAVAKIQQDSSITPEQQKLYRQVVSQQLRYEMARLVEQTVLASEKRDVKIEIKPAAYSGE